MWSLVRSRQLVNVYLLVANGTVMTALDKIIDEPSSILSILGDALPSVAVYFTCLIVIKIFLTLPFELSRCFPLLQVRAEVEPQDDTQHRTREERAPPAVHCPPSTARRPPPFVPLLQATVLNVCRRTTARDWEQGVYAPLEVRWAGSRDTTRRGAAREGCGSPPRFKPVFETT